MIDFHNRYALFTRSSKLTLTTRQLDFIARLKFFYVRINFDPFEGHLSCLCVASLGGVLANPHLPTRQLDWFNVTEPFQGWLLYAECRFTMGLSKKTPVRLILVQG